MLMPLRALKEMEVKSNDDFNPDLFRQLYCGTVVFTKTNNEHFTVYSELKSDRS